MRSLLLAGILALGSVVGINALADATQSRPDKDIDADSVATISFRVSTEGYPRRAEPGVGLWMACQGTFSAETIELVRVDERAYRAVVRPALGTSAKRRLTGCLQDATVDRLNGSGVAIDTLPGLDAVPDVDGEPVL